MGRLILVLCVCLLALFLFTGVGAGIALIVMSSKSDESKPTKKEASSDFTIRGHGGIASDPLALSPMDGFNITSPAFCHGHGIDISSYTAKSLKACSDACLSSVSYRAFQFSPGSPQFCKVFDHSTYAISSRGLRSACYVQTRLGSSVHNANDFTLIGGVSCVSDPNVCTFPETCDGNTCRRMNEGVHASLQCAKLTNEFNDPGVPVIGTPSVPSDRISISQSDFSKGFLDITNPGYYQFIEDVSIPWINNTFRTEAPHQLGQTIGLRIMANDVAIDLNGHTLELDIDMQRFEPFVNIIQLNNNNFPNGVFGFSTLISAERVIIFSSAAKKGTLKLATHFGISGIRNNNVVIKNIRIEGCALGGISLTDGRNIHIDDVEIDSSTASTLWTPFFQAVVQLRRRLYQTVQRVRAEPSSSQDVSLGDWNSMLQFIEGLVLNAGWALNPIPNRFMGNVFGIQIKNMENGKRDGGRDIQISNVKIQGMHAGSSEVVAIRDSDDIVLMDADFNVLQWDHFFLNDGRRKECASNDDACDRIKNINDIRLKTTAFMCSQKMPGISCHDELVSKLRQGNGAGSLRPLPGADIRGHTPKGAFGVRLVGVSDAILRQVTVSDITNTENTAIDVDAVANHYESPILWRGKKNANKIFKGNMAFGIYGERCTNVKLNAVVSEQVRSEWGSVIGVGFGDQSRDIILRDVSAHVVKPKDFNAHTVKLPNIVPLGMPVYLEENMLPCTHIVDISSLGVFRGGSADRLVIAVAPVIDCDTAEETTTHSCEFNINEAGPANCPRNSQPSRSCSDNSSVVTNNTCEPVPSTFGLGKARCCDGNVQTYSPVSNYVTCSGSGKGICQCPSDRPFMCAPGSNGRRSCEIAPGSCTTEPLTGDDCPTMNKSTSLTPNCLSTMLAADDERVLLTCRDSTQCISLESNGTTHWDCCVQHFGRWKCPQKFPFMCANISQECANDHCCSSSTDWCETTHGGLLSDVDDITTNNCPLPLTVSKCIDDSQCTIRGQVCDVGVGLCVGYLTCSEADSGTTASCVNRKTCDDSASRGTSCCRAQSPPSILFRCPPHRMVMCKDRKCDGDHCCVASGSDCRDLGGVIDVCPVIDPTPPKCKEIVCMDTHFQPNTELDCKGAACTSAECCIPRPTCASSKYVCGEKLTRLDSFICGDDCTDKTCCDPCPKCSTHPCKNGFVVPAGKEMQCCADKKCTDSQCCVPMCSAEFPTDASCHAKMPKTVINPKLSTELCLDGSCKPDMCCTDTCAQVDCAGTKNFFANKIGRPTGYCGDHGCTRDVCCSLTCASHTCAPGTDVPSELTGAICSDKGCDDVQCGCRMTCSVFWTEKKCRTGTSPNLAQENTLCRNKGLCKVDCCTDQAFSVGDGSQGSSGALFAGVALICGVVFFTCIVGLFAVRRGKSNKRKKDTASRAAAPQGMQSE